ncbi:SDR family oxidoreductase [bacterium]|nr:SDR family oxidoreductase [bacterium]
MEKRRFLITGGSHGIGAATVKLVCQAGHTVVFTGRNKDRVKEVAEATGATGFHADVTKPEDNEKTIAFCKEKMGGIDVLINNAAYGYGAPIGEMDVDAMRAMFETNIFGLVDLTNRVVPLLKSQGQGDIVNIASTSGIKGHANGTAYSGSKWALRGITQCWQAELRPHNIRVFCVCPSEVQTGWGGKEPGQNPNKLFAEDIAGSIMGVLSMHRRGFIPEFAVFATNPWAE